MQKEEILKLFNEFLKTYDENRLTEIWHEHSKTFISFWNTKIMDSNVRNIAEAEVDEIVKIFDKHAKGNTKQDEAVAKVMITQGVWRRMFKDIKSKKEIAELLNKILLERDNDKKAKLIDDLYKLNEGRKNGLTGRSGNAINTMIFVADPEHNISLVSLNDRRKAIAFLGFPGGPDFEKDSAGQQITLSQKAFIDGFADLGIKAMPRTICTFLYNSPLRPRWKTDKEYDYAPWGGSEGSTPVAPEVSSDVALFYMESQLEDFLIENWDKTELGEKYDLIMEDGELVSQQYNTDIGRIDILAQDKKTKRLVVIELKKNQTSDDTVGQLTRYMGWLEEHKTNGQPAKGIIIAAQYDVRLYYALKKIKDVEVYLYRVDFKLEAFKESR